MNVVTDAISIPRQFKLQERAPSASFAEERLHRKQRLAATFRLFARYGFDQGLAGHVTARDPEFPEQFWINPLAQHFSQIRVSDLQLVDDEGNILIGGGGSDLIQGRGADDVIDGDAWLNHRLSVRTDPNNPATTSKIVAALTHAFDRKRGRHP